MRTENCVTVQVEWNSLMLTLQFGTILLVDFDKVKHLYFQKEHDGFSSSRCPRDKG